MKYSFIIACLFLGACQNMQSVNKKFTGPKLLKGEIKKIWVPAQIEDDGKEYVDGHYVYKIQRSATWSR